MVPVIAAVDLTHQGIAYRKGERFDVSPIEAAALTYQRKATLATRDVQAETPRRRGRRTYRRRDLVAESSE